MWQVRCFYCCLFICIVFLLTSVPCWPFCLILLMNYIDASDTYFLAQWFPMQTPFSLGVGLVFTSLVCISERLVTFRLEKASMRLHMLQNPTWSRPVRSRNNSAAGPPTLAARPDRSSAIRALAEKSCCYALANTFRLGYMLLAMSFHTGIICVIVSLFWSHDIGSSQLLFSLSISEYWLGCLCFLLFLLNFCT